MKYLLALVTLMVFACKSPAPESSSETTTAEIEQEYNVKINIDGMTCTGCENSIESALINIEGIQAADANHTNSSALIALNGNAIDTVLIKKTITEAGYTYVSIENIE